MLTIEEYKDAASKFLTGVCLVTTSHGDDVIALTINTFTSLSLEPILVGFSIKPESYFLQKLRHNHLFAVNVLSASQRSLSDTYSKYPSTSVDPQLLDGSQMTHSLFIQKCCSNFLCTTQNFYAVGDHTMVVGKVEHVRTNICSPLVYFDRKYVKCL